MKILFVQVPTSHLGAKERVYPLGLSRLASLVPPEIEKSALDMNLYPDPWPELKNKLESINPDIVALSFRNIDPLAGQQTSYLSSLKTSAKLVRMLVPSALIIAGGPAFTLFAKRLMEEIPEIDFGLCGEGEIAFPQILQQKLFKIEKIESIPGIVWRKEKEIRHNKNGSFITMDEIPQIDTKSFSPKYYTKGNLYVAAMGIEGKRGCDLKCGYCLYPRLGGAKMRLRTPAVITDEMESLHKEFGINLFHFTDPVLNRPCDHFEALCNEILKRKIKVNWTGFFREDAFTDKSAGLAQKAGLVACYFSADALTSDGLRLLGKALTKDDILRASEITVKHNILTMCHFLVNLPFETSEHIKEAEEMMDQILDIHAGCGNLGAVILNTIRLYPDAPLTKKLIKNGLLDPDIDLLYPVYHNPQNTSYVLHKLETKCHEAGVLSRLNRVYK